MQTVTVCLVSCCFGRGRGRSKRLIPSCLGIGRGDREIVAMHLTMADTSGDLAL